MSCHVESAKEVIVDELVFIVNGGKVILDFQ